MTPSTPTVAALVEAHRDAALAAKTPAEINAFIRSIGCMSRHRWKKAVTAIAALGGTNYYDACAKRDKVTRNPTHEVTLFSDAKARCNRYAICDASGAPVWFGIFHENDFSFSYGNRSEQSACECAAARKAIWLASKIKDACHAPSLRLHLKVDAQWLCSLSGKAAILLRDARRYGIDLDLQWIPGTTNPADQWTTATGHKRWDETPLADLATAIANPDPAPSGPDLSP